MRFADDTDGGAPKLTLRAADGRAAATLTWDSSRPGDDLQARVVPILAFAAFSLGLLTWIVLRHTRDTAAAVAVSETRAGEDALTGLANRRRLEDRLAVALERRGAAGGVALLYLDLDGFKEVNDRLGHEAGDELLREAAGRLRGCGRRDDTAARLGGDEFVLLQVGAAQPEGARRAAERVIEAFAHPFSLEGGPVTIGVSVGVALVPDDARDARELLRAADAALCAVKRAGKNGWRRHAPVDGAPPVGNAAPPAVFPIPS